LQFNFKNIFGNQTDVICFNVSSFYVKFGNHLFSLEILHLFLALCYKKTATYFDTHRTKNQADKLANLSLLNCNVIGLIQQRENSFCKKRRNLFPQFCSLCFGHFLWLNFTLKIIISAKNFYLKFHKNCINCHFGNFQIQNYLTHNSFLTKKNYLILSLKS